MNKTENILIEKNIQPTATRLLVLKAIENNGAPLSLNDLENLLDTVDKSTIFRALTLFAEKGIIHEIEDGSGCRKYCRCTHNYSLAQSSFVHFTCIKCHKTVCLNAIISPNIEIPKGYSILEQSFLIKGFCPDCQQKVHD
ncbi:MAG: transcriptional repressor [Paludibacteraceae bacterium]|jgi:Fur family ferric uptake transcriptional regulator|nr:transcriptional repressor [Paludibacteraceae bacterium]